MQLMAAEAQTRCGGGGKVGNSAIMVKLLKFDRFTFGQCFADSSRPRLITTVGKPGGQPCIHSPFCRAKLPTAYTVPAEAIHEDIIGALKNHYGNHKLAAAY
jgi:hypothetical protein